MAFVQSNSGYDSGPITRTGVTAGSCLVAWVSGNSSLATTTLPSPWVKQTPVFNIDVGGCFWVYVNHPGGDVSSAITNAPGDPGWSIQEHSGRHATTPVEDEATNTGNTTTYTSGLVTSTAGADVVAAGAEETTIFTITMDSPFTRRTLESNHAHATGDDENVSAGDSQASGDINSGLNPWVAATLSLAPAGGGGPDQPVAPRWDYASSILRR